jgi:starch-binding outer membrane protein, SusD/RagB family
MMIMSCKNICYHFVFCLLLLALNSCNKLVTVPEPVNSITTTETFSTEANTNSALIDIYSKMGLGNNPQFGNGYTAMLGGLSADELEYFGSNQSYEELQSNTLLANNSLFYGSFWEIAYEYIYSANAVIGGVATSTTLSQTFKNQVTGEALFLRALSYFYLVNSFGNIPLVTTTAWAQTALMTNTATQQVYQQIISDLKQAQNLLPGDYSVSGGQRIRANSWAATALLARTYLYVDSFASAARQATAVIQSGQFSLVPLPLVPADNVSGSDSDVFAANSAEAILQWQVSNQYAPYATEEGYRIIPSGNGEPSYYLSSSLVQAFEPGDLRFSAWVDSTTYSGTKYYYPFKYTVRQGVDGGPIPQYFMVLRLAEQYLIRAEAEANQNDPTDAVNDLNTIRTRAGLGSLSTSLSQPQILASIAQERRIELFAEWEHRWFDLKRTGQALNILSLIPYKAANINSDQLLYPIPLQEIQSDPNLSQNPGYQSH